MKNKNDYSTNTIMANLQSKVKPVVKDLSPEVLDLVKRGEFMNKYKGIDNNGCLKTDFLQKLVDSTDEQLKQECEHYIWLSAYASNNPRSDYHYQCDACYDECQRRGKGEIYNKAHKYVSQL